MTVPPRDGEEARPPRPPDTRTRRQPLTRDPGAAPADIGQIARGIETLALLGAIRHATNEQLQATFAEGAETGSGRGAAGAAHAANRALRALFDGGWLDRIPVLIPREAYRRSGEGLRESYVNVPGPRGIEALRRHYLRRRQGETLLFEKKNIPRRRRPFIHPYGVVAWYFTAREAARGRGWHLERWLDDKALASRKTGFDAGAAPDGFFAVDTRDGGPQLPYFVELDLGTETVDSDDDTVAAWAGRFRGYAAYFRHHGAYRAAFGDLPDPQILVATTAEERLATIVGAAREVDPGGALRVTTFERLHHEGLFGPIWQTPSGDALGALTDLHLRASTE